MSCRGMRWRGKRAEEVRGEEEEGDRGAGKGDRLWRNRGRVKRAAMVRGCEWAAR